MCECGCVYACMSNHNQTSDVEYNKLCGIEIHKPVERQKYNADDYKSITGDGGSRDCEVIIQCLINDLSVVQIL